MNFRNCNEASQSVMHCHEASWMVMNGLEWSIKYQCFFFLLSCPTPLRPCQWLVLGICCHAQYLAGYSHWGNGNYLLLGHGRDMVRAWPWLCLSKGWIISGKIRAKLIHFCSEACGLPNCHLLQWITIYSPY